MASPKEIVRRWDARLAREAAVSRVRKNFANDNGDTPDGAIMVDGVPMAFWWGPDGPPVPAAKLKRKRA